MRKPYKRTPTGGHYRCLLHTSLCVAIGDRNQLCPDFSVPHACTCEHAHAPFAHCGGGTDRTVEHRACNITNNFYCILKAPIPLTTHVPPEESLYPPRIDNECAWCRPQSDSPFCPLGAQHHECHCARIVEDDNESTSSPLPYCGNNKGTHLQCARHKKHRCVLRAEPNIPCPAHSLRVRCVCMQTMDAIGAYCGGNIPTPAWNATMRCVLRRSASNWCPFESTFEDCVIATGAPLGHVCGRGVVCAAFGAKCVERHDHSKECVHDDAQEAQQACVCLVRLRGKTDDTWHRGDTDENDPVVPIKDDRTYTFGMLNNGLKFGIITDRRAVRPAYSFHVPIGSWDDPIEMSGAAHYVEHLTFLGSTKYPHARGYHDFLTTHNGEANAVTEEESTTYHTTLSSFGFREGLARLTDALLHPVLLDKRKSDDDKDDNVHEVTTLISEHQRNHEQCGWRTWMMKRVVSDPRGYTGRFTAGNADTLNVTDAPRIVRQFSRNYYCARNLYLAIVHSDPAERIYAVLTDVFAHANRPATCATPVPATRGTFDLQMGHEIVLFDMWCAAKMVVVWRIALNVHNVEASTGGDPGSLLTYLLNYEDHDNIGFKALLFDRGVAVDSVFSVEADSVRTTMTWDVDLMPGADYVHALQLFYAYVDQVLNTMSDASLLHMMQLLESMSHFYWMWDMIVEDVGQQAEEFASRLPKLFPHTLRNFTRLSITQSADIHVVRTLLAFLTPSTSNIILLGLDGEGLKKARTGTMDTEPFFNISYARHALPRIEGKMVELRDQERQVPPGDELLIAIPRNATATLLFNASEGPTIHAGTYGGYPRKVPIQNTSFYYRPGSVFGLPTYVVKFTLTMTQPIVRAHFPHARARALFYSRALNSYIDALNNRFPACNVNIVLSFRGPYMALHLTLHGYYGQGNAPARLLTAALHGLLSGYFATPARLARAHMRTLDELYGVNAYAHERAHALLTEARTDFIATAAQLRTALRAMLLASNATWQDHADDAVTFARHLVEDVHWYVDIFAHGAIHTEDAQQYIRILLKQFAHTTLRYLNSPASALPRDDNNNNAFQGGQAAFIDFTRERARPLHLVLANPMENDPMHCAIVEYVSTTQHHNPASWAVGAAVLVLNAVLTPHAYGTLRESTIVRPYSVDASVTVKQHTRIVLSAHVTDHVASPHTLVANIVQMVGELGVVLRNITDAEFAEVVRGMHEEVMSGPTSMEDEVQHWVALTSEEYERVQPQCFATQHNLGVALNSLAREDVIALHDELVKAPQSTVKMWSRASIEGQQNSNVTDEEFMEGVKLDGEETYEEALALLWSESEKTDSAFVHPSPHENCSDHFFYPLPNGTRKCLDDNEGDVLIT
eukprot:GEMP01001541.1.p1 GENE.GEMP01001541.1~~GEMP01001541.1.p1  ORF type:complete len:1360 (+),score=363.95 GEMP01001541.1:925-5004(+)